MRKKKMAVKGPRGHMRTAVKKAARFTQVRHLANRTSRDHSKRIVRLNAMLAPGGSDRSSLFIVPTADGVEAAVVSFECEQFAQQREIEHQRVKLVQGALDRVAEGTYGVCLNCDEEISPKRLDALPWAKYCVTCQERASGETDGRAATLYEESPGDVVLTNIED